MKILTKSTKTKGQIIRYVFESDEEYSDYINNLSKVRDNAGEQIKETVDELIELFKDYYTPQSPYEDNKPVVTVFENHTLTLAALIWPVIYFGNSQ